MKAMVEVAWLAISGLLFVLWIWFMFRALFALAGTARRAAEARGGMWPNLREQWAEFRRFATDPAHQCARWQLMGLTVGLVAMNLLGLAIWGAGPP